MERIPSPKNNVRSAYARAVELAGMIQQIRNDNMMVYVTNTGSIVVINSDIKLPYPDNETKKKIGEAYDPYYYAEISMPRCMSLDHNDFNIIHLEGNILSCVDAPAIHPIREYLLKNKELGHIHLDLNQIVWVIGDDNKPISITIGEAVLIELQDSQSVDIFTSFEACDQYIQNKSISIISEKLDSFIKKEYNTPFGAYKSHRYSEKPMDYQNKTIADSISDGDRDPINRDGGENNGKR